MKKTRDEVRPPKISMDLEAEGSGRPLPAGVRGTMLEACELVHEWMGDEGWVEVYRVTFDWKGMSTTSVPPEFANLRASITMALSDPMRFKEKVSTSITIYLWDTEKGGLQSAEEVAYKLRLYVLSTVRQYIERTKYWNDALKQEVGALVRRQVVPFELAVLPIEKLDIPVRTRNCLIRAGITEVGQLATLTAQELLDLQNFGKKDLKEVRNALTKFKLLLGMSVK